MSLEVTLLSEKLKARDQEAIAIGHPKSVGNDLAGHCAGQAAIGAAPWLPDFDCFEDPVELVDVNGDCVFGCAGRCEPGLMG